MFFSRNHFLIVSQPIWLLDLKNRLLLAYGLFHFAKYAFRSWCFSILTGDRRFSESGERSLFQRLDALAMIIISALYCEIVVN